MFCITLLHIFKYMNVLKIIFRFQVNKAVYIRLPHNTTGTSQFTSTRRKTKLISIKAWLLKLAFKHLNIQLFCHRIFYINKTR